MLTARQARFVAEYLKLRDGKAAAIQAGYGVNGAAAQAWRLLRMSVVREALRRADASIVENVNRVNHLQEKVNREVIDNAEVSVGRVLKEVAKMANFDHAEIAPEQRYRYKLPANELLARHLGMIQTAPVPSGPLFQINIHTAPETGVNRFTPIHINGTAEPPESDNE
jgi:hypothetical protein